MLALLYGLTTSNATRPKLVQVTRNHTRIDLNLHTYILKLRIKSVRV